MAKSAFFKKILLTPNMAPGQEVLVNDLTNLWVHEKYNSRKIPVSLQCAHFFSVTRGNSEIPEATFTKQWKF